MSKKTDEEIRFILELFSKAEAQNIPLWLESGWAIDARLGKIAGEHEDIDLAYPAERLADFMAFLDVFQTANYEKTDYGFLLTVRGHLLDCEPCQAEDGKYELEGMPHGSCPETKEGVLNGIPVRCTSWETILWEYFYYLEEVPLSNWREKDFVSYRSVCEQLGSEVVTRQHAAFKSRNSGV